MRPKERPVSYTHLDVYKRQGEDRLVKKSFQALARQGVYCAVAKEVIRPSAQECVKNPRARSTKMRWAIRGGLGMEKTEGTGEETHRV